MTTINRPHPHRPMHLPHAVLFAAFGLIVAAGLVTAFLMNNSSSPSTVAPIVPANVETVPAPSPYRVTSQPIIAYIVTSPESANNARQQIADVTNMQLSLGLTPSQSELFVMTEGQDIDALIRDLYTDANAFGRQIVVLDRRGE